MNGRSILMVVMALVIGAIISHFAPWERDQGATQGVEPVAAAGNPKGTKSDELSDIVGTPALVPVAAEDRTTDAAARVGVPSEGWMLLFDVQRAYAAEDAPAVEPPVHVLVEGSSEVLEHTLAERDEAGRFRLELPLDRATLQSSTLFFALDPVALDARSGRALQLDGLSDRVRLGRCVPGAGVWDAEARTLDLGSVALSGPLVTGILSLGGARFADLNVTVQFYASVVEPTELELAIGDPFTGDAFIKPVEGSGFGLARFSLSGTEDAVLFGTFGEPRAWRVAATSPNLPGGGSRGNSRPDWTRLGLVGEGIRLPAAEWLDLDLSIDLQRLPDAGLIIFREYAEPTVFEMTPAELDLRSTEVAVATANITKGATAELTLIPLGHVQLVSTRRHALEVWSRPEQSGRVRLLHTQEVLKGRGHRVLNVR